MNVSVSDNPSPVTSTEIHALRRRMHRTQAQAAGLAGVNLSTWKRWESGKHQMPRRTFDAVVEIEAIEAITAMAGASEFIVEAIVSILPPVDAPIWRNETTWRGVYGEHYDAGLVIDEDGWPSHPRRVIWLGMLGEQRILDKSEPSDHSVRSSIVALHHEMIAIPAASDPIWSDDATWRAIPRYAELYDAAPKAGICGCWPPHPRDVIAFGMCYSQPADLKGTVNAIARARAERWVASAPGREMPVLSGGVHDLWSIRRDNDLADREFAAFLRAA